MAKTCRQAFEQERSGGLCERQGFTGPYRLKETRIAWFHFRKGWEMMGHECVSACDDYDGLGTGTPLRAAIQVLWASASNVGASDGK